MKKKVIVAFYSSSKFGSEYRAGEEFIGFAASNGFDVAVVSDIDQNDFPSEISQRHGIEVICIPSIVKKQSNLYRYSDFFPQVVWHKRVVSYLKAQYKNVDVVWVQNGALPWLPLILYSKQANHIIWGPVGGGERVSKEMSRSLPFLANFRESLRHGLEFLSLKYKKYSIGKSDLYDRLTIIARTESAKKLLMKNFFGIAYKASNTSIPVIPEIIHPIKSSTIRVEAKVIPRFLWVGQDIPRKNFQLGLSIFYQLRSKYFPSSTLDVFGVERDGFDCPDFVSFHGWVSEINWESFKEDGVFLLTSFREGLPSALLEAVSNGLYCICSNVGSISALELPTVYLVPSSEYPSVSISTLEECAENIKRHIGKEEVQLPERNFESKISSILLAAGVIE